MDGDRLSKSVDDKIEELRKRLEELEEQTNSDSENYDKIKDLEEKVDKLEKRTTHKEPNFTRILKDVNSILEPLSSFEDLLKNSDNVKIETNKNIRTIRSSNKKKRKTKKKKAKETKKDVTKFDESGKALIIQELPEVEKEENITVKTRYKSLLIKTPKNTEKISLEDNAEINKKKFEDGFLIIQLKRKN